MKQTTKILNEYDFSKGIKGKYAQAYKKGVNISLSKPNDETDYLLSNSTNASRLLTAINNIENHKEKLVHKNLEDLG